jgi:hypothetical protein
MNAIGIYKATEIKVLTPIGEIGSFFTSRKDDRNAAILAKEVPTYFVGGGHLYISHRDIVSDVSEEDAKEVIAVLKAVKQNAGQLVLSRSTCAKLMAI